MLGGCLQKWVKFEGLVKLSLKFNLRVVVPCIPLFVGRNH
jgi:hypothetical protein